MKHRVGVMGRFLRELLAEQSDEVKAQVKDHVEADFAERSALQMDAAVDPAQYTPVQLQA